MYVCIDWLYAYVTLINQDYFTQYVSTLYPILYIILPPVQESRTTISTFGIFLEDFVKVYRLRVSRYSWRQIVYSILHAYTTCIYMHSYICNMLKSNMVHTGYEKLTLWRRMTHYCVVDKYWTSPYM